MYQELQLRMSCFYIYIYIIFFLNRIAVNASNCTSMQNVVQLRKCVVVKRVQNQRRVLAEMCNPAYKANDRSRNNEKE